MSVWHADLMVPTLVHAHTCSGHRNHLFESISCILRHALELVPFQDQRCAMQVRGIDAGLGFIVACRLEFPPIGHHFGRASPLIPAGVTGRGKEPPTTARLCQVIHFLFFLCNEPFIQSTCNIYSRRKIYSALSCDIKTLIGHDKCSLMHPFSILTLGIFVAGYITARWDLVTRLYELAIFAADHGVVVRSIEPNFSARI